MTDVTGMGLTKRQAECLAAIRSYIAAHGCSPSYGDLMAVLGVGCKSKSSIHRLLSQLRDRGYVQWTARKDRSLRLTEPCAFPQPASRWGAAPVEAAIAYLLPPDLQARLARFCAARGESVSAVVTDAVALHLARRSKTTRSTRPSFWRRSALPSNGGRHDERGPLDRRSLQVQP